ncbi:receptor kinase-like protein Xa21 isoform X2 [Prosopis cineraria]|uniref:receptor kinase-like protein Xa21 isoform X2 n=1 Tax=Prosopis cineraria TaxID=364024 RepID=UPI00240F13DD|nr:receptor kinase-like protein Xa21 isoform X2 [Prosopis cineraria]
MANFCLQYFSFFLFSLLCLMACLTLSHTNFTMNDEMTLLAFKFSIKDPYNHLANWSNSSSICNWVGVTCDAHNRVRILNLAEMGLNGTLPSQLGNLSFLVELDLHRNNFYGQLPKELFQLQKLEILNLSNNTLSGEISWIPSLFTLQQLILHHNGFGGVIPTSVYNLSKLVTLDWSFNFIQGSIPLEIGKLQHLRILNIAMNKLSGSIPLAISNLSSLEQIVLSHNSLSGVIPEKISHLTKLEVVKLAANQLSGYIPENIGNLTMLQGIILDRNNLQDWNRCKELKILSSSFTTLSGHIPSEIGNLTKLQELYLVANFFTGTIPMEIGNLHELKILQLAQNNLSGSIPSKIFNMSALNILSISNNSISGRLPEDFGCGLSNLDEIYLWGNKLSGRIPNTISNASKLTRIELQKNKFTGVLPSTLGHLRYLKILVVYHNNLTTADASNSKTKTSFLSSLSNCRQLEVLDLSINPLYIKLPKSIGNLSSSLQRLILHYSGIHGNIPSEIGNLTNLVVISLDGNVLNGTIPKTIGSLQALQYLSIEFNELVGLIIAELCQIKQLAYLQLSGNKFFGTMPHCLGDLTSLRYLHLGSNKLSSMIPSPLWNLKDILEVNLSSNNFVGNLSYKIGNLKALVSLDLSRNQISGIIPTTMGNLQNLKILSLAINELQGHIPESFGNLLSLESLNLSQNYLSGEIPKSLESLTYLEFVNLSYNKLQGEIPSGGVFTNLTAQSLMMNEGLCGQPQLEVPPCKKGRKKSMARLIFLKCILPVVVSTIIVVLAITLLQHKRQNTRDAIERDLSTFGVPRRISYFEILEATNRFDDCNLLGKGGYGSVYKGRLSSGMMVAIKIFNSNLEQMLRSFEVECDIMRNLRHRNLVKIISSCCNINFRSLIMEFMPNGSLEKWLHSHTNCLDFLQRLNIMINVAHALEYLHHGLSTPVVHCDLKPSNILLNDDMVAHVSDFGISKLLAEGQSMTYTKTIPTIGYIAPEYGYGGIVSTKVDVYSYGIILLEVFTRKRPTDDMFAPGLNLKSWVSELMSHAIVQLMDSNLIEGDEWHIENIMTSASSIFELALKCCNDSPETRSNMIDVATSLNKVKVKYMQRQKIIQK